MILSSIALPLDIWLWLVGGTVEDFIKGHREKEKRITPSEHLLLHSQEPCVLQSKSANPVPTGSSTGWACRVWVLRALRVVSAW